MVSGHLMRIAERNLVDGATLDELRDAAKDLRALAPDSALAELVEARIAEIESGWSQMAAPRSERVPVRPAGARR